MENKTYCGKSCEICTYGEALSCPGCRQGPGGTFAKCPIARCCREKCHKACDSCTSWSYCGLRSGRDHEPIRRQQQEERERRQQWEIRQHAPLLARWLSVLFWLFIPEEIAALMTNDNVAAVLPELVLPGTVLSVACTLLYGIGLWNLRPVNDAYGRSAIWRVVGAGCSAASLLMGRLHSLEEQLGLLVLAALVVLGINLYATYLEYNAHADTAQMVDAVLADQWRKLWQRKLWCLLGAASMLLLAFVAPLLAGLLAIAISIALIVLSIQKLVYLYRMAARFREICNT